MALKVVSIGAQALVVVRLGSWQYAVVAVNRAGER